MGGPARPLAWNMGFDPIVVALADALGAANGGAAHPAPVPGLWMREIFAFGGGIDPVMLKDVRPHSCKDTLLSWAAKAGRRGLSFVSATSGLNQELTNLFAIVV